MLPMAVGQTQLRGGKGFKLGHLRVAREDKAMFTSGWDLERMKDFVAKNISTKHSCGKHIKLTRKRKELLDICIWKVQL